MNYNEWINQYEGEQRGFSSGARRAWEHQQEIIDELKKELDKNKEETKKYFNQVLNRQDQIELLQGQAIAAIRHLDGIDKCLKTYGSEKAKRILKGEADD